MEKEQDLFVQMLILSSKTRTDAHALPLYPHMYRRSSKMGGAQPHFIQEV
jgi:hypothetical protein